MVVLNRIYTRTGDKGTTALGTGKRMSKTHPRIEAYGSVDETNAAVGLARLHTGSLAELDAMLERIQNELFDVGADLCVPAARRGATTLRVTAAQVVRLESEIDLLNAEPEAAALLRVAGRPPGGGASSSLPNRVPARRAADRGPVGAARREGRHGSAPLHEPAFRFPVRRQPVGQRPRRRRHSLAAGQDPDP